jgi:hypothetical protein
MFESVVTSPGPKFSEALIATKAGKFGWIPVKEIGILQP